MPGMRKGTKLHCSYCRAGGHTAHPSLRNQGLPVLQSELRWYSQCYAR
eukprot:gene24098-23924_t